ncbi:MAG TPA: DsrE/DsrF/DrsH-like family protein [Candidatus Acidoferrales bacterium]|jgi:peroxiredoxin family protein|nr:DsrE/DsrF/DrsH-like family protein [Candidatus Acidoferrales bacterium]
MDEPINLVLFSGTDDKLQAAAVLAAGAAALGKPVNVFLQYWALDAFRRERIERDHGLAPEAGAEGRVHVDALREAGQVSWAETFRQAKELGNVDIQACSLSMDLLGIEEANLDSLVDGVEGVTAFYLNAGAGQVVFI